LRSVVSVPATQRENCLCGVYSISCASQLMRERRGRPLELYNSLMDEAIFIKICGIRSHRDLQAALKAAPDAVGFLVGQRYASEDFITVACARRLIAEMPSSLQSVLVTHLNNPVDVTGLMAATGAAALQLHGRPEPRDVCEIRNCLGDGVPVMLALAADTPQLPLVAGLFESWVDAFVVDTQVLEEGRVGGTGRTHDWEVTAGFAAISRRPVVLAGGLTPANVGAAIAAVGPWGVDVNSGVENSRGGKSVVRCRQFVQAVRGTGQQQNCL
jgi:phosphoribosylanthranilate isomerase